MSRALPGQLSSISALLLILLAITLLTFTPTIQSVPIHTTHRGPSTILDIETLSRTGDHNQLDQFDLTTPRADDDDDEILLTMVSVPVAIMTESGIRFKFAWTCTAANCTDTYSIQYNIRTPDPDAIEEKLFVPISATTSIFFPTTDRNHTIGQRVISPFSQPFTPDAVHKWSYQTIGQIINLSSDGSFDITQDKMILHATGFISLSDIQRDIIHHSPPILTLEITSVSSPDGLNDGNTFTSSFPFSFLDEALVGVRNPLLIMDYIPTAQHPIPMNVTMSTHSEDSTPPVVKDPSPPHYLYQKQQQSPQHYAHQDQYHHPDLIPSDDKRTAFLSFFLPSPDFIFHSAIVTFSGSVIPNTSVIPRCTINNDPNLTVSFGHDGVDPFLVLKHDTSTDSSVYEEGSPIQITCSGGYLRPVFSTKNEDSHVGCNVVIAYSQSSSLGGLGSTHHYNEGNIKPAVIRGLEFYHPISRKYDYFFSSELDIPRLGGLMDENHSGSNEIGHVLDALKEPGSICRTVIMNQIQYQFQPPPTAVPLHSLSPQLSPPVVNITRQLYAQFQFDWPILENFNQNEVSINVVYYVTATTEPGQPEHLVHYGVLSEFKKVIQMKQTDSSGMEIGAHAQTRWVSMYLELPLESDSKYYVSRTLQFLTTITHPYVNRSTRQNHPTTVSYLFDRITNSTLVPGMSSTILTNPIKFPTPSRVPTPILPLHQLDTIIHKGPATAYQSPPIFSHQQVPPQPNPVSKSVFLNDTIVQTSTNSRTYVIHFTNNDVELTEFHYKDPKIDHRNTPSILSSTMFPSLFQSIPTTPHPGQLELDGPNFRRRDFSLSFTFRTGSQTRLVTNLVLSLDTEPGYNFYGSFDTDCTLNDVIVKGELLNPILGLSPRLYFPQMTLEPITGYTIKCGGSTGGLRFEPTLGRLDRTVQLIIVARNTNHTNTSHDEDEDPDDQSIYARSVYIIPSQIQTDEQRRKQLYILIGSIILAAVLGAALIASLTFCILCLIRRHRRQKEYKDLIASINVTPEDTVDMYYYDYNVGLTPGGRRTPNGNRGAAGGDDADSDDGDNNGETPNEAMIYSSTDDRSMVRGNGSLNSPTFDNFGQNRVVFSPGKVGSSNNGSQQRQSIQPIQNGLKQGLLASGNTFDMNDDLSIMDFAPTGFNLQNGSYTNPVIVLGNNNNSHHHQQGGQTSMPSRHDGYRDDENLHFSLPSTTGTNNTGVSHGSSHGYVNGHNGYNQNGGGFQYGFGPSSSSTAGGSNSFRPTNQPLMRNVDSTRSASPRTASDIGYDFDDQFSEPV